MNTVSKLIFTIIILMLFSCRQDLQPRENLLVFFDLSTSLDLNNIKSQSNKLNKIIYQLPFESNIRIYTIDVSINQDPIYEKYISKKSRQNTSTQLEIEKIRMSKFVDTLLVRSYQNKSKKKNEDFKSCIISSFEMAYNLLSDNKEDLKNTQVVFMTDRIEQCPESILGSLYMCSSTRKPNFEEILKQVEGKYNPKFKLSDKLTDDQVHVVITSSYGNQKNCITEDQQNQVWDKIFIKQGFDNPQAIYRKSSVPNLYRN